MARCFLNELLVKIHDLIKHFCLMTWIFNLNACRDPFSLFFSLFKYTVYLGFCLCSACESVCMVLNAGNFRNSWERQGPHLDFPDARRSIISLERAVWAFRWNGMRIRYQFTDSSKVLMTPFCLFFTLPQ